MSTRTLQTFEPFEQFQDDGMKHELLKGEHIVLPPAKLRHARIEQKLSDVLRPYVHLHKLGEVQIENGAVLRTRLRRSVDRLSEDQGGATTLPGWQQQNSCRGGFAIRSVSRLVDSSSVLISRLNRGDPCTVWGNCRQP